TDRSILLSSSTAICRITCSVLFFLSLPLPPTSTLFPYTTLFRSEQPSSHAGQFVSHRDREKPPSHHEAHDTSRGQLRDNRQADRAEAQLTDRVQEVESNEPPGTDQHALLCHPGGGNDEDESEADKKQTERELHRTRRLTRPKANPEPAD